MKVFILFMCAGLSFAARRSYVHYNIESAENYFEEFIKTYNKEYADEAEKQMRFNIFREKLEIINQKNLNSNFTVYGVTFFADLTTEEFLSTYTGLIPGEVKDSNCQRQVAQFTRSAPDSFDWRDRNVVSGVKDQKKCGSCYAFSATGNLESQYAIKHNQMLDVSEQQIVDCDKRSLGCNGSMYLGYPAMYWMEKGAMLEPDYPYIAAVGNCNYDPYKAQVKVSGCAEYSIQNEDELREVLYNVGPLVMSVDADSFNMYHGGVLQDCISGPRNHAVLLVGYGTESGEPYWLIKNSWGETFGEGGYIKIQRGINACNILSTLPLTALID